MALNWVMLDDAGKALPLPGETVLCSVRKASVHLQFGATHYKAQGDATISNQRLVFVREQDSILPGTAAAPDTLNTLSVPLGNLLGHRYAMPIFTAPYLEADVRAVPGGGLREPDSLAPHVGKIKLWFMESGGVAFRDAIVQAKRLHEAANEATAQEDALPAYEPRAN